MHKQILEDADTEMENFKKSLPARILKLTMGELKKLSSYDDVESAVQQTMCDLNMTVKETIQKADEGIFSVVLLRSVFVWYLGLITFSISFVTNTIISSIPNRFSLYLEHSLHL